MGPVVVTHGGAGARGADSDGCVAACQAGHAALQQGHSALAAAVAAVRVLEDDVRFNAGRGAAVRLDGKTIQLDAGVADATGFGSVAGLENVAHPVEVALAVKGSPHVMLVGAGAQALAAKLGLVGNAPLHTPARLEAVKDVWRRLKEDPRWRDANVEALWNFEGPIPADVVPRSGDTVGAVVRDGQGAFAAAGSTGGTSWALRGRVGDTPIFGAGFYVGPHGAVVATGIGEEIWRRMSARVVHDLMAGGAAPSQAVREHVHTFPGDWDVGVLAVGKDGWGARSNRDMAWAAMEDGAVVGRGGT